MNIKKYKTQKKSPVLSALSWILPFVPVVIAIILVFIILLVRYFGNLRDIFVLGVALAITLAISLPVCGGAGLVCSILTLRRAGSKKSIIAIVLNALVMALSIPMLYTYFNAL